SWRGASASTAGRASWRNSNNTRRRRARCFCNCSPVNALRALDISRLCLSAWGPAVTIHLIPERTTPHEARAMRQFTYSDAKSHKFWNIELRGTSFTVTYGRVGAKGQTQTKTFPTEEKARAAHDKLVQEKLAKGYVETAAAPAPAAGGAMRLALEGAIFANPDDLASHAAYADWLAEQGDPRGEVIQVQLALEDPNKSAAERKKLQQRQKKLLDQHARDWLGDLAPFLLDQQDVHHSWVDAGKGYHFQFARGWVETLHVFELSTAFAEAFNRNPLFRLLRNLSIRAGGADGSD